MTHVDALSRSPTEDSTDTMDDIITKRLEVFVTMTEEQYVRGMQRCDTEILDLIKSLEQPLPGKLVSQNYKLINGLLFRQIETHAGPRLLWMVSMCMREGLAVKFYDLGGHFVVDRMVAKIMERYYFPRMRRYIRVHIGMCPECALYKKPRGNQAGMLNPITPGLRPFETINNDHLGPFPRSSAGNAYVLVLIDNLTKFVKLYTSKTVQAITVVNQLRQVAQSYGLPKRIISDRGTAFQSECFQRYCLSNGILHHPVAVRHPRANGQVERVNSTLLSAISTSMTKETTWDKRLANIEFILNTTHQTKPRA